jgi:mannose/fructose-specific phosphotransferase system component IIA
MKHAILLTHGPIGEALIEAVRGIMGLDEGLHALVVNNMSVAEISARLLSLINAPEEQQDGLLIMASLKGGSCWNVAVAMAKDHNHVRVLSGVNLSMVLSFITKRDLLTLDDLANTVVRDGLRGIALHIKD